jgi:biofilm protein TabA
MRKLTYLFILAIAVPAVFSFRSASDPSKWSDTELNKWFNKKEWLGGWKCQPDPSINKRELAIGYFRHKDRWEKAFKFLKESDLASMEPKKYIIDGDNVYAILSESQTKNEADVKFEAHKKYVDIQHVIKGEEQMSISPWSDKKDVLVPYDAAKDLEFLSVTATSNYIATPDNFLIFFPSDIHRPSVKVGDAKIVRKVVIKVRLD